MGTFPVLGLVVYLALAIFMISLALRFVKAIEKMSNAMERMAPNPTDVERQPGSGEAN